MWLTLFRRARGRPAPTGRHQRTLPAAVPPSAPASAAVPPEVASPPVASLVTLGFADGGSVVLAPDDPRIPTFRAAVEAVLAASDG
jgi:hypothetical protein